MKNKLTKIEKAWILYDVGNSAFILMVSTIIPIFFKNLASQDKISLPVSTAYWGYALSLATLIIAILGPILGRLADEQGKKKRLFIIFVIIGCLGCAMLGFIQSWLAFLLVFLIARIGFSGSLVFYDSMLTDVTTDDNSDNISSSGYAWGYIGSCIPFIFCLILNLQAEKFGLSAYMAGIISFLIIAIWWILCSLPLFKNYKQIYYRESEKKSLVTFVKGLASTIKKVKKQRSLWLFMLAYFFYIDGVYTIIEMATSYGKDVGISDSSMLLALLLTQVVAFPFALIFGYLSKKFKTKLLIEVSIVGYILIVLFALQLDKAWEFWFLAVCVAVFQGAIQALSRSYFSRLVPKENSNEFFGIFDIFGKGAAFTGTLLLSIVTQFSGNSKIGVSTLLTLLIVGLIILIKSPKSEADI